MYDFPPGSYVEIRTCEVPQGWSNHPGKLGVKSGAYDDYKKAIMTDYNIPDTLPVLADKSGWYLVEGGDKKYYMWNEDTGDMASIEEPSLQKILEFLHERRGAFDRLPVTWLTSPRQDVSYVDLRNYKIPRRWSEHPARLGAKSGFYDNYKKAMMTNYNIPDPRPVLTNNAGWYLIEGGDKKYYLWSAMSDDMARIEEPSLQKILDLLDKAKGVFGGLPTTWLTSSKQANRGRHSVMQNTTMIKRRYQSSDSDE
jgi:hypothetical protein